MLPQLKNLLVGARLDEVRGALALGKRATMRGKKALRVVVFQDKAGGWRFRLVAGNGRIVSTGEAYTRKASAWRGALRVLDRSLSR